MYNSFNEVKKMENGVLLQGFHWYIKPEEKLWKQLQEKVKSYKAGLAKKIKDANSELAKIEYKFKTN